MHFTQYRQCNPSILQPRLQQDPRLLFGLHPRVQPDHRHLFGHPLLQYQVRPNLNNFRYLPALLFQVALRKATLHSNLFWALHWPSSVEEEE